MQTRLDAYGDPLPPHALARLGSLRWQHRAERIASLTFSSDASTVYAIGGAVTAFDTREGVVRWHAEDPAIRAGVVLTGPDGDAVLTVCADGTARTFDPITGALRREERASTEPLATLLAAPDGASLFLGGVDRYAALTAPDFTVRAALPVAGPNPKAAFSPDGSHLALHDSTGTLSVFRADGTLVRELARDAYYASSLCLLHGGARLLVGQGTGVVSVYDVASGELLPGLQTGPYTLLQVVATRDGRHAFTASYAHIARWNLATLTRESLHPLPRGATRLCLSPDESTLAYAIGARVVLLDTATLTERAPLDLPKLAAQSLRYDAKGDTLVSLSADRQLRWWSLADAECRRTVTLHSDVSSLGTTPTLVAPSSPQAIVSIDLDAATVTPRADLDPKTSYAWEGHTVRAAVRSGSLHLTNAQGVTHTQPSAVADVAFSGDESMAVFLVHHTLYVWATAVQVCQARYSVPNAKGFTLSPKADEVLVWTPSSLHRISLLTAKTRTFLKPTLLRSMPCAAYSPDGTRIAVLNAGDVWIVSARGAQLGCIATGARALSSLTFRADGKQLAVGAADSTITLWDVDEAIARMAPPVKPTKTKKPKA